jgi:signal transduction histidine kinase
MRILRMTSFRSTLLYAATFLLSVSALAWTVIWFVDSSVAQQIDTTVANEVSEIQADAGVINPAAVMRVVAGMIEHSPGTYYLLENGSGHTVASNMGQLDRTTGIREVSLAPRTSGGQRIRIRGKGVILPDGCFLFVGMSVQERTQMREALVHLFLWVGLITILLALATGFVVSGQILRRIETISQTSRRIMSGNLHERITLRGVEDEFDHLAVSLNQMLDRIQELMVGLQQVSSNIAHDLRTPLTRLCHKLEAVKRRDLTNDEMHEFLDGATGDANAMLETFSALLRIAQIESGKQRSHFAPVDLAALVGVLVDGYQVVAEAEGRKLTYTGGRRLDMVGDEQLLMQLVANLIDNAIAHTPEGTQIHVSAYRWSSELGEIIRVTVADNGPGIPKARHQDVMKRFFRLDASRSSRGNGLGLSLVQAITNLHAGTFCLEDNQPGLRCILDLPIGDVPG